MTEIEPEHRAAFAALLERQCAAWSAGDAAAFGEACRDDVVFTNIVGLFSVGLPAFNAQHAHIFDTIYRGSTMDQELVHATMPTADVAIVDSLTSVRGYTRLPPGVEPIDGALRTRLEQVLVLMAGIWWVASFHNVPVNPAAAAVARPGAPADRD